MSEKTEDIKLNAEKIKITDKIDRINKSGVYDKIKAVLKEFKSSLRNANVTNVRLEGRVKKGESAIGKIEKQGVTADEIYDLIGFMLIVELPEEYEKVSRLMREKMPEESFIHDFDGDLPENNGYSSFHMGVNVDKLLSQSGVENTFEDDKSLQTEVQLKSYGMYIAQESTHDSIYKNPNLNKKEKDKLQSVMFPLIEKISDIEKYQERLEVCFDEEERDKLQSRLEITKQKVLQHKVLHKQFIEDNMTDVETILKEYVVVKYIEKIRQDPILNLDREKIEKTAKQCRSAVEYLSNDYEQESMSNTEPTGFKNIDKLLEEIQDKSIEEISELAEKNNKNPDKKALEDCMDDDKSRISITQSATKATIEIKKEDELFTESNDKNIEEK